MKLKADVRAAALRDMSSKQIAMKFGLSHCAASRWLNACGFGRMFVTAEERAHILKRRTRK